MRRSLQILMALCFCTIAWLSCGPTVDHTQQRDDFVRWNKDQAITHQLFEGQPSEILPYFAYIGFYFIYDRPESQNNVKFELTTFLDKTKSRARAADNLPDSLEHRMFLTLCKLKFDYHEIHARKLRMHLLEQQGKYASTSDESLKETAEQYYLEADRGWKKIVEEIHSGRGEFTEDYLNYLGRIINSDLEDYKEFDASVNNY